MFLISTSRSHLDTLATYFFLLSFVIVIFYVVYYRYLSPLAKIPGPFTATLSRTWLLWHSWKGDMHRTMIDLHKKHGKLIRTGPNELSVADLAAIKRIYGKGHHSLGQHSSQMKP